MLRCGAEALRAPMEGLLSHPRMSGTRVSSSSHPGEGTKNAGRVGKRGPPRGERGRRRCSGWLLSGLLSPVVSHPPGKSKARGATALRVLQAEEQ